MPCAEVLAAKKKVFLAMEFVQMSRRIVSYGSVVRKASLFSRISFWFTCFERPTRGEPAACSRRRAISAKIVLVHLQTKEVHPLEDNLAKPLVDRLPYQR